MSATGVTKGICLGGIGTSFILCALGTLASYNSFVGSEHRIGGHRFDGFLHCGIPMLIFGLLLFSVIVSLPKTDPMHVLECFGRRLKIGGGVVTVLFPPAILALSLLIGAPVFVSVIPAVVIGIPVFIFGALLETIGQKKNAA